MKMKKHKTQTKKKQKKEKNKKTKYILVGLTERLNMSTKKREKKNYQNQHKTEQKLESIGAHGYRDSTY